MVLRSVKTHIRDAIFVHADSTGSSQHRGPQAAGWFVDYLEEKGDEGKGMESLVLEGGFNGWVSAGEEYVRLVDEYEAAA